MNQLTRGTVPSLQLTSMWRRSELQRAQSSAYSRAGLLPTSSGQTVVALSDRFWISRTHIPRSDKDKFFHQSPTVKRVWYFRVEDDSKSVLDSLW